MTRLDVKDRQRAIALFSRAAMDDGILTLRAGGKTLEAPDRAALLAKAVAREDVSLELDVLAYEQGKRDAAGNVIKNRKGVRFRSGGMQAFGRSGKGTPFMRDHRQGDSTARGGTVLDSKAVKVTDDGHYQILQTVRLTEPAAVERALRGLMSTVSIGWNALGPVICTVCSTEIFDKCFHFPGDVVTAEDGTKSEVEWETSDAELLETSEVPVPAVPSAEIDGIRAALSAHDPDDNRHARKNMNPKLIAILTLAATASETEVLAAVEKVISERDVALAKFDIAEKQRVTLAGQVEVYRKVEIKTAEDAFIQLGLDEGRIGTGDADVFRKLFSLDQADAKLEMGKRAKGSATPVGTPRQSDKPAPKDDDPKALAADAKIINFGGDPNKVRANLLAAGFSPERVEKMLLKTTGGV